MISHLLVRSAMIVPTWTEDRAMLGSNPSAVPGAETEGPGQRPGVPPDSRALRDQHQCDKPTVASRATVYLSTRAVTFTPNQHRGELPMLMSTAQPSLR